MALALGGTLAAQETTPAEPTGDGPSIHGSLRLRAIARGTADGTDADVYASTRLDIGDAADDRFTGHVDAYMALDVLDSDDELFYSLSDTYGSNLDARLYQAYVDIQRVPGLDRLRLGRQELWETPVFLSFDGLSVESQAFGDAAFQVGAYGGVSVHQFESSNSEDLLAGGYVRLRPWTRGRLRLDYLHVQDKTVLGTADSDLVTLSARQGVCTGFNLEGEYSNLDSEALEYRVAVNAQDAEAGWTVRATHYELFETKALLANEIDPYFATLRELFPYYQSSFSATQMLGDHLALSGGANLRRLSAREDTGEFNREFERYHASTAILDIGLEGLDFTVTGEVWESDLSDTSTWGADLDLPLNEETEVALGSYYSLYKYDYLNGQERDHVRTYFVGLERELGDDWDLDVDYEFEVNDLDDFHTLRLGLSWRF